MEPKFYFEMLWQEEKEKSFRGCVNTDFYIPTAITYSWVFKSILIDKEKAFRCCLTKVLLNPRKQIKELAYLCCNQENTRWMAQNTQYLDGTAPILFHRAG